MRIKKPFTNSLNFALEGIVQAFVGERNFKIHFLVAVLVLILSLWLDLSPLEIVVIFFAIALVLISEMINYSIEEVLNHLTMARNKRIKIAKDVAAGAVLIACLNSLVVAYLVLYHAMIKRPYYLNVFNKIKTHSSHIIILLVVILVLVVVILKNLGQRENYFKGGLISGHAALAFGCSTAILLITQNALASILAFLVAALVAHSRVEANIHKWVEVLLGALLGILGSLLIFYIFS